MKTKEELNALKEEVEAVNKKLSELTKDELSQVSGGLFPSVGPNPANDPSVLEDPDNPHGRDGW